MKKRKSPKEVNHICPICKSYFDRPYLGGICYTCFTYESKPDIPLALHYNMTGHSIDCSLGMSGGLICGCENNR